MQETYETWVQSLGQGEFPGEGHGNPLQYSCLENPMGRGTWWGIVQKVAKGQTQVKWLKTHTHTHTSFNGIIQKDTSSYLTPNSIKILRFVTCVWKIPGEECGNPLQYSCLGNPMDRGAW